VLRRTADRWTRALGGVPEEGEQQAAAGDHDRDSNPPYDVSIHGHVDVTLGRTFGVPINFGHS
jgi:hypothetical protein